MKIGLLQLRIPAGNLAANVTRLTSAVRQAAEQGATLCVGPLNGLSGWPVSDRAADGGAVTAHEDALQQLAAALHELPSSPALLIGQERGDVAEAHLLREGRIEPVVLRHGWGRGVLNDEPFAVCVGQALHEAAAEKVQGVSVVLHLDAERYTPERRESLAGRYVAAVCRLGRTIFRANAVGGSESWLWRGDALVATPENGVVFVTAPWEETVAVLETALRPDVEPACRIEIDPLQDICGGLVRGLRDFLADCGVRQAVLGLSGGMDSALVAALAVEALGATNVLGVLMSSPWTSPCSERDALELASHLGMETLSLPIAPLMGAFDQALESRFAEQPRDVTEENLQSRIRGVLLMALANKERRLLLATGNKSELGVGYCTLYGDTAGALAPLGDVYKTQVYALADAVNHRAGRCLIPASVFTKAPTAELRPGQTDQDSLPPYSLLDAVLHELVESGREPADIHLPGVASEDVQRVARLLQTSEFKRRQVPPALFVSECPFGLTRFPLAGRNW